MFNSWEATETHAHGIKSTLQNVGRDVLCLHVSKEQKCKPTLPALSSGKRLVAGTTLVHEEYFQNCFMNRIYNSHEIHNRRGIFVLFFSFWESP